MVLKRVISFLLLQYVCKSNKQKFANENKNVNFSHCNTHTWHKEIKKQGGGVVIGLHLRRAVDIQTSAARMGPEFPEARQ